VSQFAQGEQKQQQRQEFAPIDIVVVAVAGWLAGWRRRLQWLQWKWARRPATPLARTIGLGWICAKASQAAGEPAQPDDVQ